MSEKKRESNFELLRIAAALLILMFHAYQKRPEQSDYWFYFPICSAMYGGIGNSCFMLISGWFLSRSKFTWKKWILLYAEYYFYTALLGILMFCLGKSSAVGLLRCFVPLCISGNWYLRSYLIFFLFVPFLNKLLTHISRREHFCLCILFLSAKYLAIIARVTYAWFSVGDLFGFFTAFFIASYIRLFTPSFFENQIRNILFLVLLVFLSFARLVSIKLLGEVIPLFFEKQTVLYTFSSQLIYYPIALFLFAMFKNIKMPSIKAINTLGSTTTAVYLIHTQKDFIRAYWHVWAESFCGENPPPSKFFLCSIALAFATFFACAAVDLVRQRVLERLLAKYADRIDEAICRKAASRL